MLSTYIQTRTTNPTLIRILAALGFAALTALSARLTIPLDPVPFTFQVLAVLLAGLVLGAKYGAASQLTYLGAISVGLPLDANGLGSAVWASPTAGYLVGFVAAAFVAGWLAEKGLQRSRLLRFIAGLAGVVVIYLIGATWLTFGLFDGDWTKGWTFGIAPFIIFDLVKAVIAAVLAEGLRAGLLRAGGEV